MNSSLRINVEPGIGPRLIIVGSIIGSVCVSVLAFFITGSLSWSQTVTDSIILQSNNVDETNTNSESIEMNQVVADQVQCSVSGKFPQNILQWCPEISKYSTEYDLPSNLIAAVMMQESGGNPEAYSHSGAVGLMQIMPRDGIASSFMCINGPCFTNRPSISELKNPGFNIEYGTRMLAGLKERYGNIRDALKFYGPMDVGYYYADKVLNIYSNYE